MLSALSPASVLTSAAFWMLTFVIPIGYRLWLVRSRIESMSSLKFATWAHLTVRDGCASALICWTITCLDFFGPFWNGALICVVIVVVSLFTLVDAVLMQEVGARLELEMLSYAFDLKTVGGARWKTFALKSLCVVSLHIALTWAAQTMLGQLPGWLFLGLACCFVPLAYRARFSNADVLWAADGTLWRWLCALLFRLGRSLPPPAAAAELASVCIAPGEDYAVINPAYPLWRQTHAWGGTRTVSWSLPTQHKPHVIVVVMESMGATLTGCIGNQLGATPCFDAWSQKGLLYTRHYATGHSTSRSMLSALYGVLPGLRARPTRQEEQPAHLSGLPQIFAAHGYETRYMQGATLLFDEKDEFYSRRGFAQVDGSEFLLNMYPDAETGAWGAPHDAYLFDAHAKWLLEMQARSAPTFSTLLTMSNHEPWDVPRAVCPGIGTDEESYQKYMSKREFAALSERRKLTLTYADAQLGLYLERLDNAKILEQSIVIICGDTGQQYDEKHKASNIGGYLRDEAYHIPLLIVANRYLDKPRRFDHVTSQIDVLPTVMDLMGWSGPHHSMGQSLVRKPKRAAAHFTQPHSPSHFSLRADKWRFNVTVDGSAVSLFDIEADPRGDDNRAGSEPLRVATYRHEATTLQDATARLHQQHLFCPSTQEQMANELAPVEQAVYLLAPEGLTMPQSMEELQILIASSLGLKHAVIADFQKLAHRVLRSPMLPEEHLMLMQFRLHTMYPDTFGELGDGAFYIYSELCDKLAAVEAGQVDALLSQMQAALRSTPRLG